MGVAEILIETLYPFYAYIWIPLFWIMNCYEIVAVLCFVVHIHTNHTVSSNYCFHLVLYKSCTLILFYHLYLIQSGVISS